MDRMGVLMSSFAERLKRLRRNKQLTQKEAAETVGVKTRQWQEYEGGRRFPTFERLSLFSRAFQLKSFKMI